MGILLKRMIQEVSDMKQIYRAMHKIQNRILISLAAGMVIVSLVSGMTEIGLKKNALAWWGSIYPEFCFSELIPEEKNVEKIPSEQTPKISFWLAKAIERW